ncbi:MAG TPA: MCE family protein [Nocardioidaceae bacterium]|nr:MCE family protein [Nocardioidaceae bacterium]
MRILSARLRGPARLRRRLGTRLARAVVLVLVGAVSLTGCDFSVYSIPLPGGVDLGDHPYTVTVDFRDVLDLVPQSAVKVDDVTVGRVDAISLDGYTAQVKVSLRGNVKLPDNAVADIKQTSLLGEKFVSLSPPPDGAGHGRLGNGDVIPLQRTGRNPEVEEVLGALSLLLNGGGVAQLKTISTELNKALSGRETDVRSLLEQLKTFMQQIDGHKGTIVTAIRSLNKLSISLNKQTPTIEKALDRLPGAIASINRQRDDLVKMLKALAKLSSVGTRVIKASKEATIDSLRSLAPTLTELAKAGDALPKSLQVFLTYPFVDAVVGTNPAQARNLHMGDYTDLSIKLDLDLTGKGGGSLPQPSEVCKQLPGVGKLCGDALEQVEKCLANPTLSNPACKNLPQNLVKSICKNVPGPLGKLCGGGGGGPSPSLPPLPSPSLPTLPTLPLATGDGTAGGCTLGILCRPAAGEGAHRTSSGPSVRYDTDLGALLVWGMIQR